jgi:uncharacterized protein YbbC (DUF1343 family)
MNDLAAPMTGLEVLHQAKFSSLRGQRLGVVCHAASVDSNYWHLVELLLATLDIDLRLILAPEHGFAAAAQDLEAVSGEPTYLGVPVVSLYGDDFASLSPSQAHLEEIETLVIDLQDVGSRYYTFQATMLLCMEAAAKCGKRVVVLDRPNPLGHEAIEGPPILPGYESFVGIHSIPTRHGMTIGELAKLYREERKIDVDLQVIPCDSMRGDAIDGWFARWVFPSPNMPTLDTALVYPGQCLLEGTNLSEGRGTTLPFELSGAPWIDGHRLARELNALRLPGVHFRPVAFRPTFQKHAGRTCGGVQIHVLASHEFRPQETGVAVLIAMRNQNPELFRWRTERYEFVDHLPAIDLLFGDSATREAIERGATARDIAEGWRGHEKEFAERRKPYLLYPRNA